VFVSVVGEYDNIMNLW